MKNFLKVAQVKFPKKNNIIINMMPFIMGDLNSIPEEYRQYENIINSCGVPQSEIGKVGYLTIHESKVTQANSQRRGGIHTEKHPERSWGGNGWGGLTGLFMASNMSDTCRVWDEHVQNPRAHGDCEHLRDSLGEGIKMKKGELFWMTDGTPHESLPLTKDAYRQFFRLVTSEVSVWYEKHSTKNRLGILPNCEILTEDKFKVA